MSRRPLLLVAALLVLAAGCASESGDDVADEPTTTEPRSDTTTDEGPDGFTPEPIRWKECGGIDCATLEVPLDYADPDGEQIELYAVRSPATGDRRGALFVNPGGPGASAAEYAEYFATLLPEGITEHFDIVGLDPRGVGGSEALDCGVPAAELYGVDSSIDSPEDEAAVLEVSEAYTSDCGDAYGDDLALFGTREVARDMDAVRAAMGEEQLSYLGFSYGTVIGQVYADLFPERIRSMVLDGIVDLGPTGLELADEQAAGFELALDRFAEYCDAGEGCEIAGRSQEAIEEVLALAEEPGGIPAEGADRPAGPGEVNLGIGYALYSQSLWNQLDSALADALDGDGTAMVDLADSYLDLGGFEVYFAVNCRDYAWPTGDPDAVFAAAKDTATRSPHLGEALVNDYVRCVSWPVPPDPLPATTAPGTPPIVVISTTGDPATPYDGGVRTAQRLESGVLITNRGEGHTVVADGKACIDDLVVGYLVDDVVPEDGTTC